MNLSVLQHGSRKDWPSIIGVPSEGKTIRSTSSLMYTFVFNFVLWTIDSSDFFFRPSVSWMRSKVLTTTYDDNLVTAGSVRLRQSSPKVYAPSLLSSIRFWPTLKPQTERCGSGSTTTRKASICWARRRTSCATCCRKGPVSVEGIREPKKIWKHSARRWVCWEKEDMQSR